MGSGKVIGIKIGLIALLAAATFAPLRFGCCEEPGKPKVGVVLPLSGDLAVVGAELEKGLKLAVSGAAPLTMVFEDDRSFNPAEAVRAANKLVNADKVRLILNGGVNTAKAMAPVVSPSGVPLIVLWDHNRELDSLGKQYFSVGFSSEAAGEDMAERVFAVKKLKKVAIISAEDEWSEVIAEAFRKKFESLGGAIVMRERVAMSDHDFKAILLRCRSNGADALYIPVNPPVVSQLVKQAARLKLGVPLFTADGFGENEIKELGADAEGIELTQIWLEDEKLLSLYRAAYGAETSPINLAYVGLGFDAGNLVKELFSRGEAHVSSTGLVETLSAIEYRGVTGVSVLERRKRALKREPIMVVRNGKFVRADMPH